MNDMYMRRTIIDLVLWTSPDRVMTIWSFVSRYLSDELVGIHADVDELIAYGKAMKSRGRRTVKREAKHGQAD